MNQSYLIVSNILLKKIKLKLIRKKLLNFDYKYQN